MPFDVLPHHQILLPQVQFYHPSPEYARLAFERSKMQYEAIMKGLDSVLNAADPMNIAQRRLAMAKASIQMEELPYQKEMLEMDIQYRRTHGGMPMPKNYGEYKSMQDVEQNSRNAQIFHEAMNPNGTNQTSTSGGRGTGKYGDQQSPTDQAVQQRKDAWDRSQERFDQNVDKLPPLFNPLNLTKPSEPDSTVGPIDDGSETAVPPVQSQVQQQQVNPDVPDEET